MSALTITEQIRNLHGHGEAFANNEFKSVYNLGYSDVKTSAAALVKPLEASHGELLAALTNLADRFENATGQFPSHARQAIANAEKLNNAKQ